MPSQTLELAKQLIAKPSISPQDQGCSELIAERLSKLGFDCHWYPQQKVNNLWARFGDQAPVFCFAGHTDVVPPGDTSHWLFPPFTPTVHNQNLYGRGSADMKSALASMVVACENFLNHHSPQGSIAFLITSDEEGEAKFGTRYLVEQLAKQDVHLDYCLVGEASSQTKLGDMIKIGRRGSFHGKLTIQGKQGHIAYPHLACNPIHQAIDFLQELTKIEWDQGNKDFAPTSLQISNIHAGTGANNVIPGQLHINFNLRYSPEIDAANIQQRITELLDKYYLDYHVDWHHSGKPFYSNGEKLSQICQQVIAERYDIQTELSTSGGTSDGRFIIDICDEIVELGHINQTIHQINEHVAVTDIAKLTLLYEAILQKTLL